MFIFQSIWQGYATWANGKKVKFHKGMYRTDDVAIANHLRSKCKSVVTEITQAKPATEPVEKPVAEKPAAKKSPKSEE
jgi:hypothetical protein